MPLMLGLMGTWRQMMQAARLAPLADEDVKIAGYAPPLAAQAMLQLQQPLGKRQRCPYENAQSPIEAKNARLE